MSRIAVGSDMAHPTATAVVARLEAAGHSVTRCGAVAGPDTPWPRAAAEVAGSVAAGDADLGVVCCWTGTGVSIAANKVDGVRAALCGDAETARGARRWNDANVLALSLRASSEALAGEIVDAFIATTDVDSDEAANIHAVTELERRRVAPSAPAPPPTRVPADAL